MTNEPSPRPWREDNYCIYDANGKIVACISSTTDNADAALIVDAVNERDYLRDIAAALLDAVDAMHVLITRLNPNMMPVGDIPPETTVLGVDVGNAVRDARAALGDDKP